jgi:predicted heme/steroid binding protein
MTIRDRDALDDLERWPWYSDKEVRGALCDAVGDRRALLDAGDALSSAMLDEAEHGADPDEDCPICAALARWKEATG